MPQIERFQTYRATVKIRRAPEFGPVRDGVEALDGKTEVFRAQWPIDCSDDEFSNPAYHGEWAMETPKGSAIHWIASGDKIEIQPEPTK